VKLGAVALVCAVLAGASVGARRLPRLFETLATETLALYLSHVVVLYGAGVGLAHVVGRTVPLVPAIALAAVAVALTAMFGLAWNRGKRELARWRAALARTAGTG
jgi:surface polysaccharide O-acyltransferase-like enzyme